MFNSRSCVASILTEEINHLVDSLVNMAALVLAFAPHHQLVAKLTRVALGVGSGLVLDEVVFLVATSRTAEEYVKPQSLSGSIVFVCFAVILLLVIYRLMRE